MSRARSPRGAAGLALAHGGIELLAALTPPNLPRVEDISLDAPVLVFAVVAALASSAAFGSIPALKHSFGPGPIPAAGTFTRSSSRERHRTRHALMAVQVALSLVLLVGAGLMIRTFHALGAVDPGFSRPEEVQLMRIFIPPGAVQDHARSTRIQRDILERINTLLGVTAAGFGGLPLGGSGGALGGSVDVEDRPDVAGSGPAVRFDFASPGHLEALGTRLVAGRGLSWADTDEARRVVLVSENLASDLWGDPRAAIGKRIRWQSPWESPDASNAWHEIVGIVQDVHQELYEPAPPTVYRPVAVSDLRAAAYAIRSRRAGTEGFVNELREVVRASHPDLPVLEVRTLEDVYAVSLARTSFMLVLVGIAGAMALFLSVVGIYAVVSYVVSQRSREIGIRLALGAQPAAVKRRIVLRTLAVASFGLGAGLIAAGGASRVAASLLFDVRPLDPLTYLSVLALLLGAIAAAAYLPARSASRVDPVQTLRAE